MSLIDAMCEIGAITSTNTCTDTITNCECFVCDVHHHTHSLYSVLLFSLHQLQCHSHRMLRILRAMRVCVSSSEHANGVMIR